MINVLYERKFTPAAAIADLLVIEKCQTFGVFHFVIIFSFGKFVKSFNLNIIEIIYDDVTIFTWLSSKQNSCNANAFSVTDM